jgi:hypothetical protein
MLRLVTLILTGALICLGALVSVAKVANLQHDEDREVLLNAQLSALKKEPQTPQVKEKIANVSWQLNKLTDSMTTLRDQWKDMSADWKAANHKDFCRVASQLSAVYTDRANFDHALEVNDLVLKYDRKLYGESSPEVARDFNNRALCLYLKGTSLTVPKDRIYHFESAIQTLQSSNAIWESLKSDRSQFNIANNKKLEQLAQRDLAASQIN